MKKAILMLTTIAALIACSKKEDTTLSKILGTWQLDTIMHLEYRNNIFDPSKSDTVLSVLGDYCNFASDGKIYSKVAYYAPKDKDTIVYSYNNKLSIQNEDGKLLNCIINELTADHFIFETKDVDPKDVTNYEKMIIKLKNRVQP